MNRTFYTESPNRNRIRENNREPRDEFIATVSVQVENGLPNSNLELSRVAARLLAEWMEENT